MDILRKTQPIMTLQIGGKRGKGKRMRDMPDTEGEEKERKLQKQLG